MSLYNASGAVRVTVADGSAPVGAYAPDGSMYVTEAPGGSYVGAYAPDGSRYVTVETPSSRGIYAPDGSIYVSETPTTSGALYIEVASGGLGFFNGSTLDMRFTNGLYRGADVADLTVTRASTAYAESSEGVLSSFGDNVARITNRGLLVEEARTNRFTQSQTFSTCTFTESTGPTSSQTDPTGATSSVVKLTESVNNALHRAVQAGLTFSAGATSTISVFAKAAERTQFVLNWYNDALSSGGSAVFTLSGDGTAATPVLLGTGSGYTSRIQAMANGWYRCSLSGIVDAASTTGRFRIDLYSGGTNTYLGDGTSGVFIWGGQAELGAAFPTSYIPTTTVAVTRAADAVSLTGGAFSSWFNASAGTVFAEFSTTNSGGGTFGRVYAISDGTTAEQIDLSYASPNYLLGVTDGGVAQGPVGQTAPAFGTIVKTAGSFAANDLRFALNGTLGTPDTSATLPTVTQLRLGDRSDGVRALNGVIRRFSFFPAIQIDAELQAITT